MKDIAYYADLLGVDLSETMIEQFTTYRDMVIEKNQVMNLTAITDPEEFALKHFADSLSLLPAVPAANIISSKNVSMIDVGTGAGFPAIPLKIACPNIQLTIHSRAEEGGRNPKLRDHFDIAVSRAVASLDVLTEYCLPYVKVGGLFISYKSQDIEEELASSKKAINLLGGELEDVVRFQLADSDISRSFVLIRKTKSTPKAYPRKPGTAKREPLK